jgi:hypothetical protein
MCWVITVGRKFWEKIFGTVNRGSGLESPDYGGGYWLSGDTGWFGEGLNHFPVIIV